MLGVESVETRDSATLAISTSLGAAASMYSESLRMMNDRVAKNKDSYYQEAIDQS